MANDRRLTRVSIAARTDNSTASWSLGIGWRIQDDIVQATSRQRQVVVSTKNRCDYAVMVVTGTQLRRNCDSTAAWLSYDLATFLASNASRMEVAWRANRSRVAVVTRNHFFSEISLQTKIAPKSVQLRPNPVYETRVLYLKSYSAGKSNSTASEEVVLDLIRTKCIRILLYGLEVLPLYQYQLRSLDFVINRLHEIV